MTQGASILGTSQQNLMEAVERLRLNDGIAKKLMSPKERIELAFDPVMPDKTMFHCRGYIVRYSDILGPSKGGIRMTTDVTLDDVTGLAMEMTWKTALIGVPFGGGKSGIVCDGRHMQTDGKETLVRSFTRAAQHHIGPEVYVPAPDMGTGEADMGHISDCISYSAGTAITRGCYVTGKPVIVGGILGRREATGNGVVDTIIAACEKLQMDLKGCRVAVQGFGNVGSVAAVHLAELGATIVAVADLSGGIYDPNGLDVRALQDHVADAGGVQGFDEAREIDGAAVLEVDCDVLIPAAGGSQLTADNAARVKARVIAEGANAPTTPEADAILNERGIFIIPDILCNAGGVFVSYLEYTQETQREQMTLEQVEGRLRERMTVRFGEVHDYAQAKGVTMREAAMDIGVGRVVEGIHARGLLP